MSAIITRCRSCNAEIIWLTHMTSGKRAPVNARPEPQGNLTVDLEQATYRMIPSADLWIYRQEHPGALYLNHFATCPHAKKWGPR